MYCYLVDLWNRLGQKSQFGLPTSVAMESLGIGSYNTYKKTLNDLIEFGFIRIVADSKNQHQSKIIALSKNDKATDKALDEATIKATDTIIEQKNKETIEERKSRFADTLQPFLNIYGKDMLNDFYAYWTEHSPNAKKMRFEKEAAWGLERRLSTWHKNVLAKQKTISKTPRIIID